MVEEELKKRIKELEYKIKELDDLLYQKEILLKEIYSSKTWKLGRIYGRIFGIESAWRKRLNSLFQKFPLLKKKSLSKKISYDEIKLNNSHYRMIEEFIEGAEHKKGSFIIISNIKMRDKICNRSDQLSHRSVRLAKEFNKMGFTIFFVYQEDGDKLRDELLEYVDQNILQIHLSIYNKLCKFIFDKFTVINKPRILLIQGLSPTVVEVLANANSYNWITVYDCIDNWEEFFKCGWHSWYDHKIEEFVLKNSDYRITVSNFLKKKFIDYEPIYIVHNGYSCKVANEYTKKLERGKITIGYFGNLQRFRFDWEFLLSIAEKRRDWIFYLIGILPSDISLPSNVRHFSPVKPEFLYAYAKNWDVGIIPFKINPLSIACDNLKVYEYLYFGLPVVARGVGDHIAKYPYVSIAETEQEFERQIELFAGIKIDEQKISDFLKRSEWSERAHEMLNIILSKPNTYKELIFESTFHS